MVLFPDGIAEGGGCLAGEAFEEPGKVGCVFEAKRIPDLFYGEVCMKEGAFCFQGDALMNERGSCFSRLQAYCIIQVAGCYV